MEEFINILKINNYQVTSKRTLIYKILKDNHHFHLDAKELLGLAQKEDSSIGIATIYRTLELLIKLNLVVSIGDKYELNKNNTDGIYPHFVCDKCKEIVFVTKPLFIKDSIDNCSIQNEFEVHSMSLNIYGICKNCSAK